MNALTIVRAHHMIHISYEPLVSAGICLRYSQFNMILVRWSCHPIQYNTMSFATNLVPEQ